MTRSALAVAVAVLLGVVALPAGSAAADAAGPTDYRTVVVELTPPTDSVEVTIEGGDSFVLLRAAPGTDVIVHGYAGEAYLWFRADGSVAENRRSPATYYNEERYGAEVPAEASATAEPEWVVVATDGAFAWHDHRAHRMEDFPPLNVERGDQILDDVIPILVDGEPVEIHVASTWMPAPSRLPVIAGGLAGLALAALGLAAWRSADSIRWLGASVAGVAALATVVGAVQFRSLPASTGPELTWWLVPAVAMILAAAGTALAAPWRSAAVAIGAAQLGLWGFARRSGLGAAVLPTDAPFWLDRAVTTAAIAIGLAGTAVALVAMVDEVRRPASRSAAGLGGPGGLGDRIA